MAETTASPNNKGVVFGGGRTQGKTMAKSAIAEERAAPEDQPVKTKADRMLKKGMISDKEHAKILQKSAVAPKAAKAKADPGGDDGATKDSSPPAPKGEPEDGKVTKAGKPDKDL